MYIFEFGVTLLQLTGIQPWNVSVWWKKYLSYFYMIHIPFGLSYFCTINFIIIVSSRNDTRRMLEFLWRASGVFTLLAQTLILVMQGTKLRKVFDMPTGVNVFDLNPISMRKRINFKLCCYLSGIATFMVAYLIRKYILKDLVNNGNGDVEYLLPNMISNKFIGSFIHIHTSVLLFQNFIVLFGHDFLFIYSLSLIQAFLEHLHEAILFMNCGHSDMTTNRQTSVTRNNSSRYTIHYCVMLHTHIIHMSEIINSVFSKSILLLVWRAFTMSIAAYELTKRVDNMVTFMEILMFLLISLIQLLTLCLVAQRCKDQGVSLVNVCIYKAWAHVISHNGPEIKGDRRSLLVMAARCCSPLTFNAGPFYRLSLDTFLAVIGLSFSYYMFFFSLKTQ